MLSLFFCTDFAVNHTNLPQKCDGALKTQNLGHSHSLGHSLKDAVPFCILNRGVIPT